MRVTAPGRFTSAVFAPMVVVMSALMADFQDEM
jgi:hypothetical protein